MIDHQNDEWRGGWDLDGISVATGRTAAITIGLINYGDDVQVAIGVASQSPIVVSHATATEAAELFGWALEERELVIDADRKRDTAGLKDEFDRAILTPGQYRRIRTALKHHAREHGATEVALRILRESAPSGWTDD